MEKRDEALAVIDRARNMNSNDVMTPFFSSIEVYAPERQGGRALADCPGFEKNLLAGF
jgi:hypothetical protein